MTDANQVRLSRTKHLHHRAQRRALEDRGYRAVQATEIVKAAHPRLALVVDDWVTTLLEHHTPGILGLILSVTLYTVAVHKQEVRRGLLLLYGISFPVEVTTARMMERALDGALRVLIARQARGDFREPAPRTMFIYNPADDSIEPIACAPTGQEMLPRSKRHNNPPQEEEEET